MVMFSSKCVSPIFWHKTPRTWQLGGICRDLNWDASKHYGWWCICPFISWADKLSEYAHIASKGEAGCVRGTGARRDRLNKNVALWCYIKKEADSLKEEEEFGALDKVMHE